MEEQRDRARKAQKREKISIEEGELKAGPIVRDDFLETESVVEAISAREKGGDEAKCCSRSDPLLRGDGRAGRRPRIASRSGA